MIGAGAGYICSWVSRVYFSTYAREAEGSEVRERGKAGIGRAKERTERGVRGGYAQLSGRTV